MLRTIGRVSIATTLLIGLSTPVSAQEPYPSLVGEEVLFDGSSNYNWEEFQGFSYHPSSAAVGEFQADDITMEGFGLAFHKLQGDFSRTGTIQVSAAGLNLINRSNLRLEHDRDGNIYVLWEAVDLAEGTEPALYFRRYDSQAEPIDDGQQVSQTALDDNLWLWVTVDSDGDSSMIWRSSDRIMMRRFSAAGVPLTDEVTLDAVSAFPKFATDGEGNLLLVWVEADAGGTGIFGRKYSSAGAALGDAFQINDHVTGDQSLPAVAMAPDGTYAVSWRSASSPDTEELGPHAHFRLFDSQGVPVAPELRLGRSQGALGLTFLHIPEQQAFREKGETEPWRLFAMWVREDLIEGQYISTAGSPIGSPIQISTTPELDQYPVTTAYVDSHGGNELMVAWRKTLDWANGGGTVGWVLSADLDTDRVADRMDNCVSDANPGQWDWDQDGPGDACDFCLGDDNQGDGDQDGVCNDFDCDPIDGAAAYVDGCGVCGGDSTACTEDSAVNDDPGDQTRARIGTGALGDFVIVWESTGAPGSDDDGFSVHAQRYTRDGDKVGGAFQVNEYTTGNQFLPSVAVARGGSFVVAWESQESEDDTSSSSIRARFYASDGAPLTSEMLVNNWTTGSQRFAQVAPQGDDQFVITWAGVASSSNDFDIRAQRFDTAGQEIGQELQPSSWDGTQTLPAVESAANGDFVIAWTGNRSETYYNIYFQRYRADGTSSGGQTRVDTNSRYSDGNRYSPGILVEQDGSFIVSWASDFNDDSGLGAMAERFDSSGQSLGDGSFRLNAYTAQNQGSPSFARVEGELVTVWESQGSPHQAGNDYSIEARIWQNDEQATTTAFQVSHSSGNQRYPQIARSWDHGFRVVWTDYSGPDSDIRMRHFDGPGLFIDGFESGDANFWSSASTRSTSE